MDRLFKLTALLCATLASGNVFADKLSINRMDAHDVQSQYFQLDKAQKVEIEFLAPKYDQEHDGNDERGFVWLIDLDSREMVWNSHRSDQIGDEHNSRLAVYGDKVSLAQGRYGLFYSTHNFRRGRVDGVDVFLYGLSSLLHDDHKLKRADIDDLYVDLRATDIETFTKDTVINPFTDLKPLVALTEVGKHHMAQYGLDVAQDTELGIYAIGEIADDQLADSAWLKDAANGEILWQMDQRSSEAAGGADKNRRFKGRIKLKQGRYVLSYSSDGSHHYDHWNSQPPFDPAAWGISAYVDKDAKITLFDPVEKLQQQRFLAITEVGDNVYLSKHFSLSQPADIRVIAMGERRNKSRMADHGWIVNSQTNQSVWQMKSHKTSHAGGARKNRLSDEVIALAAGSYTLYYASDGSHSYDDGWNAAQPQNEKQWGISLYGVGKDFDQQTVKLLENNALASILGVKNNAERTATFELSEDQSVRVYAIGEADGNKMTDHGYIKSLESGKRVWAMYADETEHAGGAKKNRMVDDVIELKKGRYKLHYKTDDSHSFNRWNATPPDDERHYGIAVYGVKN